VLIRGAMSSVNVSRRDRRRTTNCNRIVYTSYVDVARRLRLFSGAESNSK